MPLIGVEVVCYSSSGEVLLANQRPGMPSEVLTSGPRSGTYAGGRGPRWGLEVAE